MKGRTLGRDKALDIINRLKFFRKFTPTEKERLVQFHQHFCIFEKGEEIIREGSVQPTFFILLAGKVKVGRNGGSVHIVTLSPEEFFGEISFFTQSAATASVIAEEESIAILVDEAMLVTLNPETREKIKDKVIEKLAERLDRMNKLLPVSSGERTTPLPSEYLP